MSRRTFVALIVGIVVVIAVVAATRFDLQRFLVGQVLTQQAGYFDTPTSRGAKLDRLADRVYTYHWEFDRTLVVDTDEGLVVIDPFNRHLTSGLMTALREHGLDTRVHTVVYTHYHFDHVRGAQVLQPQHVLAHVKAPEYWRDFEASDIVPPTRLLEGDVELEIGGTRIRLLYMGLSHTDTLYAVHLPQTGIVFASDLVGVKVFLPAGGVSLYTPGYFRALDRLAALDFETFVASHFGWGTKADFIEAVQLQRDIHAAVQRAMASREGPVPIFQDSRRLTAAFGEVYDALRAKYGHWHGFDSQVAASFGAALTNHIVGN